MTRRLVVLGAAGSAVAALAAICVPEVRAYRNLNAITRSLRDPIDEAHARAGGYRTDGSGS